jgi:hypothetical protein
MSNSAEIHVSMVFQVGVGEAWRKLTGGDITAVSQPWGPIPGVVAVHDEPADFFNEAGQSRILENSDGSTVIETITALNPPYSIDYMVTDLTNSFRYLTSGARSGFELEPVGDRQTRITWRYVWNARNVALLPPLWLIAHIAFRRYMRHMLERIGRNAVQQGTR